ncbi:MAG: hypothetical protein FWD69_05885 [Polyangiaceae bacterium]|nr:hypothetical protein [Polyangiaceae bacterium]
MTKSVAALLSVLLVAAACVRPEPKTPVAECVKKCSDVAASQCSSAECERGCEFILDRVVERETNQVLACVARGPRRCGDVVWAHCAVHVGVHADGGPPAPPPPSEDD